MSLPKYAFKPENIAVAKLLNEKEFRGYINQYIGMHADPEHSDALALPTPELSKEQERDVIESVMSHSTAMALSLNNDGIFTVKPRDAEHYTVSLNPDAVVSKANYKKLVEIGSQGYENTWKGRWFNKNDMPIRKDQMPELFEINRKTLKYSQEDLTTILENRLAGTYRDKFDEGKTWNKDGIGERLGTWGNPGEEQAPAPKPVQFDGIAQIQTAPAPQPVAASAPAQPALTQKELDDGLKQAYADKNYKEMDSWLEKGADVDYQCGFFLEDASIDGDIEAVKVLLKHHATLSNMDGDMTKWPAYEECQHYIEDDREGALNMAASGNPLEANHYDVAKALIEAGADVNEVSPYGGFALLSAAENGNMDMIKLLIDNGADIDLTYTQNRRTALSGALNREHYDVATYLLDNGANPEGVIDDVHNWGTTKDAAREFLAEYQDAQHKLEYRKSDISNDLKDIEKKFEGSHTEIKHFHSMISVPQPDDSDYYTSDYEVLNTWGKNKESGNIQHLAQKIVDMDDTGNYVFGASLELPNVYSYLKDPGDNNEAPLGVEYKDAIRAMHADAESRGTTAISVLAFATEELNGDVRFMNEMANNYPNHITKYQLSESLQEEVGNNDVKTYLRQKVFAMDLQAKIDATYGTIEEDTPVQKLGRQKPAPKQAKETPAQPKPADSEADWESGKVSSMEEAQARMKASRERSMALKNKI